VQHAHQRSWQTCGVLLVALVAAACATDLDQDTIWPPADFSLTVEEVSLRGGEYVIERRFRARADGLACFATASGVVVDPETGTPLPVWTRLSVYQLVPTCTRALARRVHRAGVLELERTQGQRESDVEAGTTLRWRAFDKSVVVTSRGRVHGPMAEILAVVAAHLPTGEELLTPGVAERGIASVLRGVPEPREDADGALRTFLELLERFPDDTTMLVDAFALACRVGRRPLAEQLLDRWTAAEAGAAAAPESVTGEAPPEVVQLSPAILRRMLPPARSGGPAGGQ